MTAAPVVFTEFYHDSKVYFLCSVEPPPGLPTTFVAGYPLPHPFHYVIWCFDVDTFPWGEVIPPAQMQRVPFDPYWSFVLLQVCRHSNFKIFLVGEKIGPAVRDQSLQRFYIFGLDSRPDLEWVLEKKITPLEFVNSKVDEWGLSVLAFDPNEALDRTFPHYAKDCLCRSTNMCSFDTEQKLWRIRYIFSPQYDLGELPVTRFFPCSCGSMELS